MPLINMCLIQQRINHYTNCSRSFSYLLNNANDDFSGNEILNLI